MLWELRFITRKLGLGVKLRFTDQPWSKSAKESLILDKEAVSTIADYGGFEEE